MTEFRVGDRVRAIMTDCEGRIGTIAGNYCNLGWDVLMDDPPRKPDGQAGWYHRSKELELTPSPEADALDRIADLLNEESETVVRPARWAEYLRGRLDSIAAILRETGRM